MKIPVLAAGFLLSAALAQANPFSFADNYFKDPTVRMPSLSLLGDESSRENLSRSFGRADGQHPDLPAPFLQAFSHFRKSGDGLVSHMPVLKPNPTIDYKMIVATPAAGVDYKLRVLDSGIVSAK